MNQALIAPAAFALFLVSLVQPVQGCTVPVFRFALDRWPADAFRLEVAPADAARPEVAGFLRNFGANSPLNLNVSRLPAGTTASRLLRPQSDSPLWEGALDGPSLRALIDSPARRELIRRILDGDSVVWVLAESPGTEANERVAALLEKRLRYLTQVAQLPAIDPDDPDSQLGPGPALAVRFSLLRVGPQEIDFRRMLAGADSGLETSGEPWVAAIFGRGRVLGAWPAADVGDEQIEQACLFLLGACSCQVKTLNPGWDLLLGIDWDAELQALGQPAAADSRSPAPVPETVKISGASPPSPPTPAIPPAWLLAAAAAVALAIGIVWQQRVPRS